MLSQTASISCVLLLVSSLKSIMCYINISTKDDIFIYRVDGLSSDNMIYSLYIAYKQGGAHDLLSASNTKKYYLSSSSGSREVEKSVPSTCGEFLCMQVSFKFAWAVNTTNPIALLSSDGIILHTLSLGTTGKSFLGVTSTPMNTNSFPTQLTGTICEYPNIPVWASGSNGPTFKPCSALAGGDPHFRTWGGSQYDYMGSCDLVLVKNARLDEGTLFHVHIRTLIDRWWSFIEKIAIQVGKTTLEFQVDEARFLVDGKPSMDDTVRIAENVSIVKRKHLNSDTNTSHFTFVLTHNGEEFIRINGMDGKKKEMAVFFVHPTEELYAGSAGMLGEYPTGRMMLRDGITVVSDPDLFSKVWHVQKDEDQQLFVAVEGYPLQTCLYPSEIRNFDSGITLEDATIVCQQNTEFFDFCIHDVMSTGDVEVAELYVRDVIDILGSTLNFEANKACSFAGKFSEFCFKEVTSSGNLSIAREFTHLDPIEEGQSYDVEDHSINFITEAVDSVSTDDSVSEDDAKNACRDAVFHFSSCVEEVMVMNNLNIGLVYALEKLQ